MVPLQLFCVHPEISFWKAIKRNVGILQSDLISKPKGQKLDEDTASCPFKAMNLVTNKECFYRSNCSLKWSFFINGTCLPIEHSHQMEWKFTMDICVHKLEAFLNIHLVFFKLGTSLKAATDDTDVFSEFSNVKMSHLACSVLRKSRSWSS